MVPKPPPAGQWCGRIYPIRSRGFPPRWADYDPKIASIRDMRQRVGLLARQDKTAPFSKRQPPVETMMRKPRDFDAELKALGDKARGLKSRKVQQLGELVIATGADALSADELAGALIVLAETKDAGKRCYGTGGETAVKSSLRSTCN
jgi:hypothetical protein